MPKLIREAYVYGIAKARRDEMYYPNTVVHLVTGIPYSDEVVNEGIDGHFRIRENEECPFKDGDLVKVTIELKKRSSRD